MNLLEQARIARRCLPETGQVLVNHTGKNMPEAYLPALLYFQEANCSHAFIAAILDAKGEWTGPRESSSHFYDQSPSELSQSLRDCFHPVYSLANGSLDHIFDHGFNRHDPEHIDRVTKGALELLKKANQSELVQRRAVAAARGHDLGNPLSRRHHSLISPIIFRKSVPSVETDSAQWRIIRRAMQLHNESVAQALIKSWGQLNEEAVIQKMRTHFGPEALALIIADKTDIGRHRISEKAENWKAIDEDPHLEVNLLGKTEKISLSEDRTVFTLDLHFTPGMSEEEQRDFYRFSKGKNEDRAEYRAMVSQETHQLHREYKIPHFDRWKSLFWSLYFTRMQLTIRSAFALYPELKTFVVTMSDADLPEQSVYSITKDTLQQTFEILKAKYSLHSE